jgi:hypothetical protein
MKLSLTTELFLSRAVTPRFWPHRRMGAQGTESRADGEQFSGAGLKANLLDHRSVRWTLYCVEVGYSIGLSWLPLG